MNKFIVLTFGFLGWAFYELSGGGDYEPRAAVPTEVEPVEIQTVERIEPRQVTPLRPLAPKPQPVQREFVVPVTLEVPQIEVTPEPTEKPATNLDVFAVTLNGSDLPTIVPRTEAVLESIVSPITDVRQVTGNLVNMRSGPGTTFSVVDQVLKGADVEVLSDAGDGWLHLRVVGSGQEGYMADWLVTAAIN